jgi:hypothetical protein
VSEQIAEPEVQQTLGWEASNRTKAVAAAAIGGIFVVVPTVYIGLSGVNSDAPEVGPLQALTPALSGQFAAERNPRVALIDYWAHHSGPAIIAGVLLALSMLGIGYVLWYLFHATRARRPELPVFARWLAILGPVCMGLSSILVPLFRYLGCNAFDMADAGSRSAVDAALGGSPVLIAAIIGLVGQLSLALAFVLISLNAMRVGLLTQFMGIIGIIVGALYVFQVGPAPILQAFWLLALVPLFLHRWPSGTPAAWTRGIAVPWPTAAERRAAMQPATAGGPKNGGGGGASSDLTDDAADPRPAPNRPQHTSRKRRKR